MWAAKSSFLLTMYVQIACAARVPRRSASQATGQLVEGTAGGEATIAQVETTQAANIAVGGNTMLAQEKAARTMSQPADGAVGGKAMFLQEAAQVNAQAAEEGKWFFAYVGETCDAACTRNNRMCDASVQSGITSPGAMRAEVKKAFGVDCRSYESRSYAGSPFFIHKSGSRQSVCFYLTPGSKSVCNANAYPSSASNHRLMCYCQPLKPSWVFSRPGVPCDTTCERSGGRQCDAREQSTVTSSQILIDNVQQTFGVDCRKVESRSYAGSPFFVGGSRKECYYLEPGSQSVCNANAYPSHHAMCYCQPSASACQRITGVDGDWIWLGTVIGTQTRTETFGTDYTKTKSDTQTYTTELTVGVQFSGGTTFAKKSVSAQIRTAWSGAYTTETSVKLSASRTFSIQLGENDQGKSLWQFEFESVDRCDRSAKTKTKSYALTSTASEYPCCFPGHCLDASLSSCDVCADNLTLPSMLWNSRCREGWPPCEAGSVIALKYELPGYVTLETQLAHNSTRIVSCPNGFSGTVALECEVGQLAIVGQSCIQEAGPMQ